MKLAVVVATPLAYRRIEVEGETLPEAFSKIPQEAANQGLALTNDGTYVRYVVRVKL